MASIDDFKSNIAGGGARANQYRVILAAPGATGASFLSKTQFLVKTTSLPGQTITEVPVNFRGRQLFLAGDRTFETWTTTVINDVDFHIRRQIETWMSSINSLETNQGFDDVRDYTAQVTVEQLDRNDKILRTYLLKTCWPTVLGPVELSYDTVSDIETFDITWRYTDFSIFN